MKSRDRREILLALILFIPVTAGAFGLFALILEVVYWLYWFFKG